MKVWSVVLGLACAATSVGGVTISFEDRGPALASLTSEYSALGVTFSSQHGVVTFDIISEGPGYNTSSPRNVAYAAFVNPVQDSMRIDFALPASGVSFYAIDVGESSRVAQAFDASDTLLESISVYNAGTGAGIGNIDLVAFSASGISYVTFGQGAVFSVGDGAAIDDLTFTIPSPGTLMVGGVVVLGRSRRR